jgi:integrase
MRLIYSDADRRNAELLNKELYNGNGNETYLLRVCCMGYFKDGENPKEWAKTFTGAFLRKYPQYTTVIRYIEKALGKERPNWEDMTRQNLIESMNFIQSNVCAKSAKLYSKVLNSIFNDWKDDVELPTANFRKALYVKDEPSQSVYLNEDEIAKIVNYTPANAYERTVQAQFLCEYYLGGRRSDLLLIKREMIDVERKRINYVSQKTKSVISAPLHANFLKFFDWVDRREISQARYYVLLREICRKAGINEKVSVFLAGKRIVDEKWKFVGSHTARRSYACNLYLRGCDIYTIARRMGHSSVKVTEGYLVMEERELPSQVNDWINS